jgi:hypothetical protein
LPRLGFAEAFGAILKCYGDALNMAYVEPFQLSQRQEDRRIRAMVVRFGDVNEAIRRE